MLQAYIDDSHTIDSAFVLAGYIAPAEKWAAFSDEWQLPKTRVAVPWDGVDPHSTMDFMVTTGLYEKAYFGTVLYRLRSLMEQPARLLFPALVS